MKPRDFFAEFPEPDELTTQCEQAAQNRAWREKKCAACGQERQAHGFKASSNEPGCQFVEAPVIGHIPATDPSGPHGPSLAERQERL